MHKGHQDKSDFLRRVASHATKGGKTGIVSSVPNGTKDELEADIYQSNPQKYAFNQAVRKARNYAITKRYQLRYFDDKIDSLPPGHLRDKWIARRKKILANSAARDMAYNQLEKIRRRKLAQPRSDQGSVSAVPMRGVSAPLNNTDAVNRLGGPNTDVYHSDERRNSSTHTQDRNGHGQHNSYYQYDYERGY